jgi:hypothetical protein
MKLKRLGDILCESHDMITMRAGVLYGRQMPLAESGRAVWRSGYVDNGYSYLRMCDDYVVIRQEKQQ